MTREGEKVTRRAKGRSDRGNDKRVTKRVRKKP